MNNEIKEILDDLDYAKNKERGTITLNQTDINFLLDYITNLQEEYDNEVEENLKLNEWLVEKHQEKEDYKSRIEKAIEYIKDEYYRREDNKFLGEVEIDGLLKILEGNNE